MIGINRIQTLCEPLFSEMGRPSIQPGQLFLAAPRQYRLGVTSERALMRGLTGSLVPRRFAGLDLDTDPWDHPTFSQNRKRRFTESGLLEQWFDETLSRQAETGLHAYDTRRYALAGECVTEELCADRGVSKPVDYKGWIRSLDQPQDQDSGNSTVTFREERCSNQTHVSPTNPDAKLANKRNGTVAMGGDTVNELMENRHQLLLGINVESFRCPASEREAGAT